MDAAEVVGILMDLVDADLERDEDERVGGPATTRAVVLRFHNAGVKTQNDGFVLMLADGSEFQITVLGARWAASPPTSARR